MSILITWVALTIAFWLTSRFMKGFEVKGGVVSHLVTAALFGTLHFLLGSLLVVLLSVFTLGIGYLLLPLTQLVAMTLILILTDKMTDRLKIDGFGTAFIASLILTLVGQASRWAIPYVLHS